MLKHGGAPRVADSGLGRQPELTMADERERGQRPQADDVVFTIGERLLARDG